MKNYKRKHRLGRKFQLFRILITTNNMFQLKFWTKINLFSWDRNIFRFWVIPDLTWKYRAISVEFYTIHR